MTDEKQIAGGRLVKAGASFKDFSGRPTAEYFYHLFIASDIKELAELNKHKVLPHIFQLPLYWLKIYVSVFICMFAGFILNAIFEK